MADVFFDIFKICLGAVAGSGLTIVYNSLKAEKAAANQCRDKLDSLSTAAEKAFRCREGGTPDPMSEVGVLVDRSELGILTYRVFGKHQCYHRVIDGLAQLDTALEAIDPPSGVAPPRPKGESTGLLRDAQKMTRAAIFECCRDTLWIKLLGGHQLQP